jgi:hypothetical protein
MRLTLRNYCTGELQEVDSDRLTDDLARQLIPQDRDIQAIYTMERRAYVPIAEALTRANLLRFDLHGRR